MMEIPYTVLAFADYNFQFVIKSLDDPHNSETLQRVDEHWIE
jgi:hypothetical protein